ncbi:hypothetical protein DFAR_440002 [Desulfarculales bacterium]
MLANRPGPKTQNALADQTILLIGSLTDCPYPLRRLVVWDEENQKQVVLLTNHHKLTASIVADIYSCYDLDRQPPVKQKTPAQTRWPYFKNC